MSLFWQNVIALSVVALAASYVLTTAVRWWLKKTPGGCGKACGGCATDKPLVSLDLSGQKPHSHS